MSSSNDPQGYFQKGQYPQPNAQYGYQVPMSQQYSASNGGNNQDLFKPLGQPTSQPPMLQSFNPYNQQQELPPGWQFVAPNQQAEPMQGKRNPQNIQQMNKNQGFQMRQMVQSSDSQKYLDQSVPYQQGDHENDGQYYYQQGQEQQQQGWSNKFFEIFQRYEWAYDRFQQLREMYSFLHNKLQTVDSQDDWNEFKSYHEQLFEKFEQMQYQMNTVMSENQRLMEANANGKNQNANWQQRYKELLGNFKTLQEQSKVRNRQSYQQDDNQKDNNLKQLNELKQQYMRIYNALQAAQQHIGQLTNESGKYQQIIENLQNNLNSLQQNNAMMQRQLASKPSISRQDYDKFNAMIDQRDAEIRKLKKELTIKDNEVYSRTQQQMRLKNQQINNLKVLMQKMQRQLKSSFSDDFNTIISIKSDEIAQYRKLLKSSEEQLEFKLRQRQEQITKEYEERISTLQTQLKEYQQRESDDNPIATMKLVSYEKKITYYQQQIQNLNQMLNKKNQEINRLRDLTYQLQNMKTLKNQKAKLQEANQTLSGNLQNKNRQVQQLKFQISQLQNKLKETNQKRNQANARGFIDEIRDLKEIIAGKDREISKIRQNQQAKEKNINQLQHENQITREKLITKEKNFEMEKQQLRNQIRMKQSRNLDLERKIRNIQLDFGQSAKNNLLSEISTLRSQNQSKQEMIIKLQNQEIELKGQITHFQRQKKDLDHEVRTLKTKNKQQLSIKADLTRKIDSITIDTESKNKIIRSLENHQENLKSQIEKLQKQIVQAQNTLKSKNAVISQLQDKLQNINDQYSQISKERDILKKQLRKQNDIHEKDVRQLKYKLQESEQLIKSGKLWSNLQLKNNQNQQLIKKLKADNEVLRNQLTKTLDGTKKPTAQYLVSSQSNQAPKQQNYLEIRLRDFNSKLDEMMGRKAPTQQSSRVNKQNQLSINDKQQVKTLKDRIVELQQYCSTLQQRIGQSDFFIKSQSFNGVSIFNEQQKIYNQQLNFHKKKAQQFQQRIDSLLKINNELKGKLAALLKSNPDQTSSSSFYKNQLQISEKNNESLNQKIRKLTQQNILLKKQSIQYSSNTLAQYQSRITEFQNTVQDLQRKIRQLQIEKVTTENEKATLKHTISRLQSNIEISKSNLTEKISMYESLLQQTKNKYMSYDQNIKDMSNSGLAGSSRLQMM